MKQKLLLISILLFLFFTGFFLWKHRPVEQGITLKRTSFNQLPGWSSADLKESLQTFQRSCKILLKQKPEQSVGSNYLALKAKDWHPACQAALQINALDNQKARKFFQQWFAPVEFYHNERVDGLFTGYYMPLFNGSLTKTDKYSVPLYGLPSDLISINLGRFDPSLRHRRLFGRVKDNQLVPYYTREEINHGVLKDKAPILLWLENHIDRLFLEIQGSGVVQLPNGERLYVGYAGENGAAYKSIAQVLINKGVFTKDTASMQAIRAHLQANPKQVHTVLNQNKSFVFFEKVPRNVALGTQGVALTPGYSLAIDRKWIPLGAPLWLNTTVPDHHYDDRTVLQRLVIAQDTGGAIRGMVRGDVYWGTGDEATYIAGHMKNKGHYWLLLPQHVLAQSLSFAQFPNFKH